jgi:hypothetical protein
VLIRDRGLAARTEIPAREPLPVEATAGVTGEHQRVVADPATIPAKHRLATVAVKYFFIRGHFQWVDLASAHGTDGLQGRT